MRYRLINHKKNIIKNQKLTRNYQQQQKCCYFEKKSHYNREPTRNRREKENINQCRDDKEKKINELIIIFRLLIHNF
jgi:hypothetical protein